MVPLVPMNDNQKVYIDHLFTKDQVIVCGFSGTGKTYIAATMAANMYNMGQIDKIILTRPNVSVGKDLGYFPGTLEEKFAVEFGVEDIVRGDLCKSWIIAFESEGL